MTNPITPVVGRWYQLKGGAIVPCLRVHKGTRSFQFLPDDITDEREHGYGFVEWKDILLELPTSILMDDARSSIASLREWCAAIRLSRPYPQDMIVLTTDVLIVCDLAERAGRTEAK